MAIGACLEQHLFYTGALERGVVYLAEEVGREVLVDAEVSPLLLDGAGESGGELGLVVE